MSPLAGSANPRLRAMTGWQRSLIKLRLLGQALYGVGRFRLHNGYQRMFPWTVQVQTDTGCNSACRICPHRLVRAQLPQGRMEWPLFQRIADECLDRPELLGFALSLQNEPLVDDRIYDMVRYAAMRRTNNAVIFLSTNGIELHPDNITRLQQAGLDYLQISINAHTQEAYERLSPGRRFATLQRNLDALLRRDLSQMGVQLSFVRTRGNHDEVQRAVRAWRERGVQTSVQPLSNRAGALDNFQEHCIERGTLPLQQRLLRQLVKTALPVCPYVFFQASIIFNGDVLICAHDWNRQVVLGSIGEASLEEVWNSERTNRVRRAWIRHRQRNLPACSACSVYHDQAFS